MRRLLHIALILALLPAVQGCDFFRTLAGRPTSAQIAEKARRMELQESARVAEENARRDSLAKEAARLQVLAEDSVATVTLLHQGVFVVAPAKNVKASTLSRLDRRYYVVLGSFGDRTNAEKLAAKITESGHTPVLVDMTFNGFTTVTADPCNRISDAYAALQSLRGERYCPEDVWIMEVVK